MRSAECGMRADRLRALNVPQRVEVELDADGRPTMVRNCEPRKPDDGRRVEAIGEIWRIDDEWWRQPISRLCIEVILDGGKHVVLFEDLVTREWWMQKP